MLNNQIRVLLPVNGKALFDYQVTENLELEVGSFVEVSFRNKQITGVVWEFIKSELPTDKLKFIEKVVDLPGLSPAHLKIIEFVADYNIVDYGLVLKMMVPVLNSINKLKQDISKEVQQYNISLPKFTAEQDEAIRRIYPDQGFKVSVLDGVTGSGKTEVYFAAISEVLQNEDGQAIVLLPEIMLTTQLLHRVEERFGIRPATWHSDMTLAQKKHVWIDVLTGKQRLVIGARSALFLPYKNLRLIVVDEEHDGSYKQEEGVVYNARDTAIVCAHIYNISVVLVSATPSMETLMNVAAGKYQHVALSSRYGVDAMPAIELVDMRNEQLGKNSWISLPLRAAIIKVLESKKQVMLFLNRRGYAPITICKSCGYKYICPDCSSYLVSHVADDILSCHHCNFSRKQNNICLNCEQHNTLIKCGPGVERVAEEVAVLFPEAKIRLITRDTVQNIESAKDAIDDIVSGKVDIIIGTQMISKGHDFPNIALVGVVDADLGLTTNDLRASEKTYHLLLQMSGRAGRRDKGKAIIQTYYPESPILSSLLSGDRDKFIDLEMQNRKLLGMPPYGKLAAIILSAISEEKLVSFANQLARNIPEIKEIMVFGPVKAPLAKIRKYYRYRFLIKTKQNIKVQKYIKFWLSKVKLPSYIRMKIDIDPYNFM